MREIKFRAWDNEKKKMTDAFSIDAFGFMFSCSGCYGCDRCPKSDLILMQYTGLKDNIGRDVYEDDIVEDEDGYTFIVKWEPRSLRFGLKAIENNNFDNFYFLPEDYQRDIIKVIGNIHETPDLLK